MCWRRGGGEGETERRKKRMEVRWVEGREKVGGEGGEPEGGVGEGEMERQKEEMERKRQRQDQREREKEGHGKERD